MIMMIRWWNAMHGTREKTKTTNPFPCLRYFYFMLFWWIFLLVCIVTNTLHKCWLPQSKFYWCRSLKKGFFTEIMTASFRVKNNTIHHIGNKIGELRGKEEKEKIGAFVCYSFSSPLNYVCPTYVNLHKNWFLYFKALTEFYLVFYVETKV